MPTQIVSPARHVAMTSDIVDFCQMAASRKTLASHADGHGGAVAPSRAGVKAGKQKAAPDQRIDVREARGQ